MSTLINNLSKYHDRFFAFVSQLQSPFLLLVRLYWGWQLIESGWGKLHNLDKVTQFFGSLNLPMPAQMAVFISCLEFFGGIFLAIGLLSRLTALALTINMLMAYITADREALFFFFPFALTLLTHSAHSETNFPIDAGTSRIDFSVDSNFPQLSTAQLKHWVQNAADAILAYYGRYSVPHVALRIRSFDGKGVRG